MLIYRVTNRINGKVYIGQTQKSLEIRKKRHLKTSHKNYFQIALKKYGLENFYWEILEDNITNINHLNQREQYYIKLFKSNDKRFGYNLTEGGYGVKRSGWHHRLETKEKIGRANKGLHRTQEQRVLISEAVKKAGWRHSSEQLERMRLRKLGKKHSEEIKRKQSLNQIGLRLGWKHNEETKKKISNKTKKYSGCTAKRLDNCSKYKGGRFCIRHGSQYKRGIIDINGNVLRDRRYKRGYSHKLCLLENYNDCSKNKDGRFCTRHYAQYRRGLIDINGNRLRNKKSKKGQYTTEHLCKLRETGTCSGEYESRGFCSKHRSQYRLGIIDINGNKLRNFFKTSERNSYGS